MIGNALSGRGRSTAGIVQILSLVMLIVGWHISIASAAGEVDLTFDAGPISFFNNVGEIRSVVLQSDEKILIGGLISSVNGMACNSLARLNSDGSLDQSFNPPFPFPMVGDEVVWQMALQPDGKILVAGRGLRINDISYSLVRLNQDGSRDVSFSLLTKSPDSNRGVESIAVQPDGKILIGGDFMTIGINTRKAIVRLNPDGTLDPSFDIQLSSSSLQGRPESIVVLPNEQVLAGGNMVVTTGASTISSLVRLNPDGSPDVVFNPEVEAGSTVHSVALRADGSIYIAGNFTKINGTQRNCIARLNADGTLDPGFSNLNFVFPDQVYTMLLHPDGKLFIGGDFGTPSVTSVV